MTESLPGGRRRLTHAQLDRKVAFPKETWSDDPEEGS